jgi:hypothetical protein
MADPEKFSPCLNALQAYSLMLLLMLLLLLLLLLLLFRNG